MAAFKQAEKQREVEGQRLYLRNILQRYMESEDHEALFPVVATCLQLTPEEVQAIRERRAQRQQRQAGLVRRLLGTLPL